MYSNYVHRSRTPTVEVDSYDCSEFPHFFSKTDQLDQHDRPGSINYDVCAEQPCPNRRNRVPVAWDEEFLNPVRQIHPGEFRRAVRTTLPPSQPASRPLTPRLASPTFLFPPAPPTAPALPIPEDNMAQPLSPDIINAIAAAVTAAMQQLPPPR